MAHKKTVILIMDCNRKEAVQSRWDETLDLARLEEAQIRLDKGQWEYAKRVLEDCRACFDPGSSLSGQTQQILAKIQTDRSRNAKVAGESQAPQEMVY